MEQNFFFEGGQHTNLRKNKKNPIWGVLLSYYITQNIFMVDLIHFFIHLGYNKQKVEKSRPKEITKKKSVKTFYISISNSNTMKLKLNNPSFKAGIYALF